MAANFGVHAGFVWRRIDQLSQSDNLNRPVSAFNVPITVRDPGPDGTQTATGTQMQAWNLNPANLALPIVNFLHNTPGRDDFYNIEFSANKRMSNKWSLNASYAYRWNHDNATGYFGQTLRVRQDVANPNDAINTDNGQFVFGLWSAKINGSYERTLGPEGDAGHPAAVRPAVRADVPGHDELRHAALSGRADRLTSAGQHHPRRHSSGEGVQVVQGHERCPRSSTATT